MAVPRIGCESFADKMPCNPEILRQSDTLARLSEDNKLQHGPILKAENTSARWAPCIHGLPMITFCWSRCSFLSLVLLSSKHEAK